jgi:voltage-gated potassium channel
MKFLPAQLAFFFSRGTARRNLRVLRRYLYFLAGLMVGYSVLFHFVMLAEGQQHSWVSGFYWTIVTMTTLGYGDIVFESDLGRAFSTVVILSGVVFLLVVLPFTFIQFFYAPWLEAQTAARARRELPPGTHGHVILSHYEPIAMTLIDRLRYHGIGYVVLEPDITRALALHDEGVAVMVGERDDLETYRRARADDAAIVAAVGDDYLNTNIVATVRELSRTVPIVATARAAESIDILQLAGADQVFQLPRMLGRALARRAMGGDVRANVIGRFGELLIAEAPVMGTPWVGKQIAGSNLRGATGLTVVGLWERGEFSLPLPDTRIMPTTVLLLAGSEEQLSRFSELTTIYNQPEAPVLILGGGRVGRAAATSLREREVPYRIVEKDPSRIRDEEHYVLGSAADLHCLERAGIAEAPTTLVTTNDDATNIYLTIYCRRLRPDIQLVSRATLERNVSTLHRAGADFVMSYASMGANAIYNTIEGDDVLMLAEGLDVFRYPVPPQLVGVPLLTCGIREATGCSVVAFEQASGTVINPPASATFPADSELILIGTTEGERSFVESYGRGASPRPDRRRGHPAGAGLGSDARRPHPPRVP